MKIAIGTAQFGLHYGVANSSGKVNYDEAKKILDTALNFGVDTIDTAISYGESESVLGSLSIGNFKVITKLPYLPNDFKNVDNWLFSQVQGSLLRLKVSCLDGLLIHHPAQLLSNRGDELFYALEGIKSRGMTKKIGISIYDPLELDNILNHYRFDIVQAPMNILDRRLIDSGWAYRLKEKGVDLHARSVFLQGLLLMSRESRPIKFNRWDNLWKSWDDWLCLAKVTPLQACIQYLTSLEYVDVIVVGVDSSQQFSEIIQASSGVIPHIPVFNYGKDDKILNPSKWQTI